MSTDNLSLFAAVQETDPRYTKGFSRSGGFKGTAVSAPWLVRRATEQFGPVGIGWGWTIDDGPLTEAEQKALVKPILARVKSGELTVPHAISMIQDLPGVSDAVKDAAHTNAMELAPIEEMPEF